MKWIKGVMATLMFFIMMLIVLPLVAVLLVYTPDTSLPEPFVYDALGASGTLESILSDFDLGSLDEIRIPEEAVNRFVQTYVEEGLEPSDFYEVNYVYVDFKPQAMELGAHVTLTEWLGFPMRLRAELDTEYSDGVETLTLKKVKLGRLGIPNFLTRFVLDWAEVESPYLVKSIPALRFDLEEMNPYRDWVGIEDVIWEEEAIRIKWGLSAIMTENLAEPAVEILEETLNKAVVTMDEASKEAAEEILDFVETHPAADLEGLEIEEVTQLMESFEQLDPQVQNQIIDDLQEQLDPETLEALEETLREWLGE